MIAELEAYLKHIEFAQDCFIAYKSILDSLNPYNEQINLSPGFFTITMNSLSKCLCIELAKLYIGSGQEKTIRKLLNQVSSNRHIFPKEIKTEFVWADDPSREPDAQIDKININSDIEIAQAQLEQFEPIIVRLKSRRDKYLAHNDPEFFDGKVNPAWTFPVAMCDVHALIHFAGNLCNKLLSYLDRRVIAYQSQNADDLTNLLNKLI